MSKYRYSSMTLAPVALLSGAAQARAIVSWPALLLDGRILVDALAA